MICGSIFPRQHYDTIDKEGCLKEHGHFDAHVFRNSEGELIEWEWDEECTCGCWDEEGDPCIVYHTITEEEFKQST